MRLPAFINKHFNFHEKEIAFGSSFAFAYRIIGLGLTYLLIFIINKYFGTDAYGIYSICISTIYFFSLIGSIGLNTSILRYVGQFNNPEKAGNLKILYKQGVKIILLLTPPLSLLLYLFSDVIADKIFHNLVYAKALKYAAFIGPIYTCLIVSVEYLRGLKKLIYSELLRSVVIPSLCIIILYCLKTYSNEKLIPLMIYGVAVLCTILLATSIIIAKLRRITKPPSNTRLRIRDMLQVSWPIFLGAGGLYMMDNIGLFLVQSFFDETRVGVFSIVLKFSILITIILTAINTIAAPIISELFWGKKDEDLKRTVQFAAKTSFYLSTPIFLVLILFPAQLLAIFDINEQYAAIMLIIIAIGQYINVLTGSVGVFLDMTGNQKTNRNIIIISTTLTILLSFVLIKYYGMIGLAVATAFGFAFLNVVRTILVYRKFNVRTFYLPFLNN